MDVAAFALLSQIDAQLLPGLAIKLVITCHVENGYRPVSEQFDGLGPVLDIAGKDQYIGTGCRLDQGFTRKSAAEEFQMEIGYELNFHRDGAVWDGVLRDVEMRHSSRTRSSQRSVS